MIKLLLTLVLLTGCGVPQGGYGRHLNDVSVLVLYGREPTAPIGRTVVDPDFRAVYSDFIDDAVKHHAYIHSGLQEIKWTNNIVWGSQDNVTTVGLCSWNNYPDGTRASSIQILRNANGMPWDPVQLRTVLYHELGHCLLGLDHTPANSHQIMDPVVSLTSDEMVSNWDKLVTFEFDSEKK